MDTAGTPRPIEPATTGQRVTIRHREGAGATDVIGRVVGVDAATVRVERRDGSLVEVHHADIVLWRVVPARPVRSRRAQAISADDLARIASRGWPAIVSQRLGDWELRAAGGFTGRANSVAVHGDPGVAPDVALRDTRRFYADHDQRALAQVVVGSVWDEVFAAHDWRPSTGDRPGAVVQVADLRQPFEADPEVEVAETASDAWLATYGRSGDAEVARQVLEAPLTRGFISLRGAIGRIVVTGEWAGISCVEVPEASRREGLGRRIVSTALAWAVERGADKAYLQTMRHNTASLALYATFGFADHHEYRYLTPAAQR